MTSLDGHDRVLIVGGGIGGLASAAVLEREGIESDVFERAPALQEVGAGISLWSNAVEVLSRIGLDEKVVALGTIIRRSTTMTASGRVLGVESIEAYGNRAGFPSACVHRADLQRTLASAIDPKRLHLNAACDEVREVDDAAVLRLVDGREEQGTLLVGADGIASVVRRDLHGPSEPRPAGYVAYRGIAPHEFPEVPPGEVRLIVGRGSQVGLFPCGPRRLYWFATVNLPRDSGDPSRLVDRFRDWCDPVAAVMAGTPTASILRHPVLDRPPLWPWGRGRMTLLGDSAHAATPNLGQGACQAIEDAVVLAASLRRHGLTPGALRHYEEARRRRAELVIRSSRSLGQVLQWERGPLVRFRDLLMASGLGRNRASTLFERLLVSGAPR